MGERSSGSGGKARQAFGRASAERPVIDETGEPKASEAPARSGRHAPSNVQGALDKMAAGMGERRRAREEARERAAAGESA
ncbi:MAG TPA: hypothetical protein VM327_02630 [Candidatus Thermoplasmatota archaeon]|nr:hypothetical protein [Candidatus Thermoplasmatota archaeon]